MAKVRGFRTYRITIVGTQPLIFHHDDVEWQDEMGRWRLTAPKGESKAGDDRTPAYRWMGCLYRNDAGEIVVPTANIMSGLKQAAVNIQVPGGKRGLTFKGQSQSGILPRTLGWPLILPGQDAPLRWESILPLGRCSPPDGRPRAS